MKHIKFIYILMNIATILIITSCGEDFLYKAPQGSIDGDALKNETGINMLTTTAYTTLTDNNWKATPFNWTFGGIYGGEANKGSDANDQSALNDMEKYSMQSTNSYLNSKWNWIYKGVKRANITLQTMAEVKDLPEDFIKSRNGELHFLRALFYFEGIRVFGPYIPWVDESYTENDPKVHNDINIYDNVLKDMDIAIQDLPEKQDLSGRANSWAAKALKAKILMQKGDIAAAKPILKDVIDNGMTSNGLKYGLEDDMNLNFSTAGDNGKESIFAVQFSNSINNANTGLCLCYPYGPSAPGGCCGFYQPSSELANSFKVDANGLPFLDNSYRNEPYVSVKNPSTADGAPPSINNDIPVDPRLDFAVGRFGIPYKDWGLPQTWVRDVGNGGFFMPKKHVYTKKEKEEGLAGRALSYGWAPGSAINLQYLSFRDAVLLYAECLANDGELSAAMEMVNMIRARAAKPVNIVKFENGDPAAQYLINEYPSTHETFSDKEMCIKAIRMERKLELAMEAQRWFDLTRWGGEYMAQQIKEFIDFEKNYLFSKYSAARNLDASKTMFPIPERQIQTMGKDEKGEYYLVQPDPWK